MQLDINGQVVAEQILNNELLRLSSGLAMDSPHAGALDPQQLRSAALRNIVRRVLLYQAALAEGLRVTHADAEAERVRRWGSTNSTVCGSGVHEAIVENLLVERMSALLTRHVQRPGRAEAEEFYRHNRQLYLLPEAVHAAHIVRNIEASCEMPEAEQLLCLAEAELARGRSFNQVAERYSDCKGSGGSLGWVSRGQMVPEFEHILFALQVGQRSSVFQTVFGLHIAIVMKKRAQGYQPFDEVRLQIASSILATRRQHVLTQALSAMERASEVKFIEETENA